MINWWLWSPSSSSSLWFLSLLLRCRMYNTCWNSRHWIKSCFNSRVRPIPFWRPIPDTIGRSCTDTDTDTGNDITYSLGQTCLTYVAHTVHTFQNITPLTLRFETFETNYRCACNSVDCWDRQMNYWYRHRYQNKYRPIPDTGIGLTLFNSLSHASVVLRNFSMWQISRAQSWQSQVLYCGNFAC